jgi:hypothetical protein
MPDTLLSWREVGRGGVRELVGYEGRRVVARVQHDPHGRGQWRWSVPLVVPARPWLTHGFEAEVDQAQVNAEAAWAYAKANGEAEGDHIKVENWTACKHNS